MLTYTVKDKWSLPFDIFCFDLNCSEYYNNKYPILIEPAATYSLIPYEYMELIKKTSDIKLTGKDIIDLINPKDKSIIKNIIKDIEEKIIYKELLYKVR